MDSPAGFLYDKCKNPLVLLRSDLESVISFTMHKSIYRHMFLWLEIDFIPVYLEGYYGTGIGGIL